MVGRVEVVFHSRRFLVDVLMGIAALLLALAAFATTADPYLLAVLSAALIGVALVLEPRAVPREPQTGTLRPSEWHHKAAV